MEEHTGKSRGASVPVVHGVCRGGPGAGANRAATRRIRLRGVHPGRPGHPGHARRGSRHGERRTRLEEVVLPPNPSRRGRRRVQDVDG